MTERDSEITDSMDQSQHVVERLRSTLGEASSLLEKLGDAMASGRSSTGSAASGAQLDDARRRLSAIEADRDELASLFVQSEQQASRIMNLYVATYQLHATLDPEDVEAAIGEIAADLLGAERYLLLLRGEEGSDDQIALREGLDEETANEFAAAPEVRATLADGVVRIAEDHGASPIGVVPLRVQENVVGALVIVKLFDHKDRPLAEDRELLDLMAAHVASALFAARAYQTLSRKLRTLQDLTGLLRATPGPTRTPGT